MIERKTSKTDKEGMTINFLGEEFLVKGEESPEYVFSLLRSLEDRLKELSAKYPQVTRHKLIVLLVLSLADELAKLKQEYAELSKIFGRNR